MSTSNDNATSNATDNAQTLGAQLAAETIGCRVRFNWLTATRSLDDNQQAQTAALFSADTEFVKASKKLFDNKRPEFRAVNRVKNSIRQYWQSQTLPFTEPGVRLLKRSNVAEFSERIEQYAAELAAAVDELDAVYSELLDEARARLGSLYNPADYPGNLREAFSVASDFPNLAAPEYLAQLSPELFERERNRVNAEFSRAVELAESAFAAELLAMVERITETLNGSNDGKPKIFRDSLVENVNEFFERFRALSIGSSAELDEIVDRAQTALAGVTPAALRSSVHVRDMVSSAMAGIQSQLESNMIDKPARRIRVAQLAAGGSVADSTIQPPSVDASASESAASESAPAADDEPSEPAPAGWESVAGGGWQSSASDAPSVDAVAAEPATSEPAAAESVDDEPSTIEPPADEPAPAGSISYNLNYGGGVVRRLVIAGR